MTVTVHCINSFLDYDIDQKNPCEKDELLELRIQDQDNEPQRKQLNRRVNQTNAVMLVSIEFSSLASAHYHISWKLYKLPQKDNCKPIKH